MGGGCGAGRVLQAHKSNGQYKLSCERQIEVVCKPARAQTELVSAGNFNILRQYRRRTSSNQSRGFLKSHGVQSRLCTRYERVIRQKEKKQRERLPSMIKSKHTRGAANRQIERRSLGGRPLSLVDVCIFVSGEGRKQTGADAGLRTCGFLSQLLLGFNTFYEKKKRCTERWAGVCLECS